MSLHVRVCTNFYTHRKTMRLKSVLGDDAYWVPPRLWAYAAVNQPDGDLSSYSDQEIAMLIGYSKDATSMLQALLQAGFLDTDRRIHDWAEHNGYHAAYAERARVAAKARWEKERSKERGKGKGNEKKGKETSIASSMLVASVEQIAAIYQAYPLKVGKPAAFRAITTALKKEPFETLLAKTQAFAAARNGDTAYCPNPSTWFNQERYNDDPATWRRVDTRNGKFDHRAERRAREYPQEIHAKLL